MEVGKKCRTVLAVLTSPLSTEIGLKQAVMVWSLFPHPSSSLNCDEAKLSKVNLGHWWKSKVWRCHFVWLKVGCPGCARKGDVYQMCLSSKPCSPGRQASLRRGWSCVSCVLVDMDSQGVPFAQPAQGGPWLGHPQSSLLLIWYLGMLEWAEESECRGEEMYGGQRGAGCVVLGIFREHLVHIHEEVRGFIF